MKNPQVEFFWFRSDSKLVLKLTKLICLENMWRFASYIKTEIENFLDFLLIVIVISLFLVIVIALFIVIVISLFIVIVIYLFILLSRYL